MPYTLPLDNQTWPDLRVLTRAKFGASTGTPTKSGAGWTLWPTLNPNVGLGVYVLDFDRCCLPAVGRARFGFRYGRIDGRQIGASSDAASTAKAGQPLDLTKQNTALPELSGFEVRIQACDHGTDAWRTVWWGTVDTQEDGGAPGSTIPMGDRIYHCLDALHRTSRWRVDRHGYHGIDSTTETFVGPVRGHPGYNIGRGHDARIAANRYFSASQKFVTDAGGLALYHADPGGDNTVSEKWTDQQVIEHALEVSRRPGEPSFALHFVPTTADSMLQDNCAWRVEESTTAWDMLTRVLRRERGRGVAFVDWEDDSSSPTGPLTARLTVMPQFFGDVTYQEPGGTQVSISGATNDSAAHVDVDLIGDHRCVAESFALGDRNQHRLDALETVSEPIEVLVTVGFTDSGSGSAPNKEGRTLVRGWSGTDQTTFRGKTAVQRQEERFRAIYNRYRLPAGWDFIAGDGDNSTTARCDYRLAAGDDGSTRVAGDIVNPGSDASDELTSLLMTEIAHDLPLYENWDYRGATPVRWDAGAETLNQPRRPILALLRVGSGKFIKVEELVSGMALRIEDRALWFYDHQGLGDGTRAISDTTLSSLGATTDYTKLCFTIALRLPHRVRFYSGKTPGSPDCRRRVQVYIPDHHLWLAHPGAIWDLDASSGTPSTGHAPRWAACLASTTSPGKLRDDRASLARLHYLTWAWYGADRRTATWALRACGFLPSYQATSGLVASDITTAVAYPTIGQTVRNLVCNGSTETVETPITRVHYDNQHGVTTWSTEWSELDHTGNR